MSRRPRALWIGDAVIQTGFGTVTHGVVPELDRLGWDVAVLGVGYNGLPHDYRWPDGRPWKIYPSSVGGDLHGFGLLPTILGDHAPDVVIAMNDPWVLAEYAKVLRKAGQQAGRAVPFVGYMPVDGELAYPYGEALNAVDHLVLYTEFGRQQIVRTGYRGPSTVIPHGIDLDTFQPMDQADARAITGLAGAVGDGLLFLNVNTNQWRKRLDLAIAAFAAYLRDTGRRTDLLILHCRPKQRQGWDLDELVRHYGLEGRVGISTPERDTGEVVSKAWLRALYASADVQISPTLGEGWGLTTMEGMACGLPQIVPEWSALAEWPSGAVEYVPPSQRFVSTGCQNNVYGVIDPQDLADRMADLALNTERRRRLRDWGLARVREPQFRWSAVGEAFDAVLEGVVARAPEVVEA